MATDAPEAFLCRNYFVVMSESKERTDGGSLNRGGSQLFKLTFPQVEERLRKNSGLIVPIASLEPFGLSGAIGCAAVACQAIAERIAAGTGALLAPGLWYGYATPYRGFGGSIGLKAGHLATALTDILRDCAVQGMATVFLVDGSYDALSSLQSARRRLAALHPDMHVEIMAWQHEASVRTMVAERAGSPCGGRLELGILSIASCLEPSLVDLAETAGTNVAREPESSWRKRGRDPEKLRKLMPSGSACPVAPEAAFGEALLVHIANMFTERAQAALGRGAANG